MKFSLIALVPAGLLVLSNNSPGPYRQVGSERPIRNVIVVVEQNHTFDAYFGEYPGVRGFADLTQPPAVPDGAGGVIQPTPFTPELVDGFRPPPGREPLSNGRATAVRAYAAGRMDGFAVAQNERDFPGALSMVYHDRASASGLWELADEFVLFDGYFSSVLGGSLPNMLTMLSGDSHGFLQGSKRTLAKLATSDFSTVFDLLAESPFSWKYYIGGLEDLDPEMILGGDYLAQEAVTPPALYWAPIISIHRFWTEDNLRQGLAHQQDFYTDAATGALPNVSFILPKPTDHPIAPEKSGETRLLSIVNAVMKSPQWSETIIFVVWDDWGGFYDHVPPPPQRGFRVPAIAISPWVKQGYVSHTEYDHSAIYEFIVTNFELQPTSEATALFQDIFHQEGIPRPGELLTLDELPPTPVGTSEQNRLIVTTYMLGFGVVGLFLIGTIFFHKATP